MNATGAVNFELTDLETESSQTFQTAYTLADFADSLSKELNGTRYCNAHRRFLFGHLPLTQFQMEKAGLASTPAELKKFTWNYITMALELRPCQSLRSADLDCHPLIL